MFEEIDAMLEQARASLEALQEEYRRSLAEHDVSIVLRNNIRRLLADLRDPLDHIYQQVPGVGVNGKFPVSNSAAQFANAIARLDPAIAAVIRASQSFGAGDPWLQRFSSLSNIHKHIELVPQIRTERRVVSVTPKVPQQQHAAPGPSLSAGGSSLMFRSGGRLSFGPGGFVSFGAGGQVSYSGVAFNGGVGVNGVRVDPQTQMPEPSPILQTEVQIWVNFLFDPANAHLVRKLGRDTSIAVLPFLNESLRKVQGIVDGLKPEITRLTAPAPAP